MNPMLKAALQYATHGFFIFPVPPGEKKSYKSARFSNGEPWGRTCDEVEIKRDWMRWPQANVGIVTGPESGFWVLELDTPLGHDVDGFASLAELEAKYGALPDTRQAVSPTGSRHYYFRWPASGNIKNSASEVAPGIDVRGEGGMVLAPPSIRPGRGEYKWFNKNKILEAPQWLLDLVVDKEHPTTRVYSGNTCASPELVAAAVATIPNDATVGWTEWNNLGMAIWSATSGHEKGLKAFDAWSQKWSGEKGYDAAAVKDRWEAYSSSPPTQIGAGTVFHMASDADPNWRIAYEEARAAAGKGLPIIRIEAGELASVASASEATLIRAGVPFYQRGGMVVRPISELVEAAHSRFTTVAHFKEVSSVYMRDMLCRNTDFRKFDGRSKTWKVCDPPIDVGNVILERAGDWKFPVVSGIISTPTMRPDGSILDEPGYDQETRLLLVDPIAIPEIKKEPTREDGLAALGLLKELLVEFPFADEVSVSVGLSALITPVVRGAFPVTPMHVARAPVNASGKSYLFDVVAALGIGQLMPVMAAGANEEETEKRLGAALLAGQPLISIDNVNGELRGASLCQVIERPIVQVRILGKSERVSIEARGTSVCCTGNNLILVEDVIRRSITATLDPKMERPEFREFRGNPVATVLDNRGLYVAAAMTVCRSYIAAGRPLVVKPLVSFEGWSETVRSALVWLGQADPVESQEKSREEDPATSTLQAMLQAWATVIGTGVECGVTAAEAVEIAATRAGEHFKWPDLHAAVQATGRGRGPADARTLGNWLRHNRDKRGTDNFRFEGKINRSGVMAWWVENDAEFCMAGTARAGNGSPEPPMQEEVPF